MSEQEVPPSIAQRIVIKFLAAEGVKPAEILRRLTAQFGEKTLSRARVFAWHKQFVEGRERVENESHDRRPRTSITAGNIDSVRQLVEGDRRLTTSDIAIKVGISYGSTYSILSEELGYRKVCARWVPRLLTVDQKLNRFQVCKRLLARFREEGDPFLSHIVTCDETWVHHYTPESKQASMEWRKKGETGPVKAKSRLSAGKVLATVFFDQCGLLHLDFLHERRTINAAYYCKILTEVRLAYRRKRRHLPMRKVILLHDNARPHTEALTVQKLEQLGWETLEHPPYSPDLSPCDFHVFGPLKEALGGQKFHSDNEVEAYVRNWLQTRPDSFYLEGIKKLRIRWEKCVSKSGDYVEK
ncbi:histone-lysine N-methyltransferase SETMAR-like [Diorhabda carinulata]|uniref:histone-lysine N-methyltransferase SETMAR-like n=1 Tax=Diorhabda carinulata TaxID=1163345 RepID=UPI0025A028E8|nr:histone-lysine N-methyltransferase SETMAR-like [Diorhabda carinulata]